MTSHEGAANPAPEFSRMVQADHIPRQGQVEDIEATPSERDALARRFDLEAVDRLSARLRLKRVRGGQMIRVEGRLEADVVQTCVVTLDPVRNHVEEEFAALFAPPDLVPETDYEIDVGLAEEDEPEAFLQGRIDLGELTAQHLSLALDPYPRCPGVDSPAGGAGGPEGAETAEAAGEERRNPFEALAKLRSRR